ncbi:MAG: 3,4-dihydroxy-2-butanone-4-phosphate synthase [Thermoplasmatota archaeon]
MSAVTLAPRLARAAAELRQGRAVCVFDSDKREAETDLFFAAEETTSASLTALRHDAGGLVFLAVDHRFGEKFGLPFLQDLYAEDATRYPVLAALSPTDIKYDKRSSFSLTINHRDTFTGIPDDDRALTVREFARTCAESDALETNAAIRLLGERFRAPGHVALCVGAKGGLGERRGHTELGVALATLSGLTPVLVGAEMLGEGRALPRAKAEAWAEAHGIVRLSGDEILDAWARFSAAKPDSTRANA